MMMELTAAVSEKPANEAGEDRLCLFERGAWGHRRTGYRFRTGPHR